MPRYQRTTNRRYYWGIGVVCSLLFLAFTCLMMIEGRIGIRLRGLVSALSVELKRQDHPTLFWLVAAVCMATSLAAVVFTARGLTKTQRDEKRAA